MKKKEFLKFKVTPFVMENKWERQDSNLALNIIIFILLPDLL
jgi:hypothetical protein